MLPATEKARYTAELLQLFSKYIAHPTASNNQHLFTEEYILSFDTMVSALFLQDKSGLACSLSFEELETQYIAIFNNGKNGQPIVCLNAGDYGQLLDGLPRTEFMLEYSHWYKYFGIEVRQDESSNELHDHICCQIEFLSWLASLEASSDKDSDLSLGYAKAQRDFIDRHFKPFLTLVVAGLKTKRQLPQAADFYLCLLQTLLLVVTKLSAQVTDKIGLSVQIVEPSQAGTSIAAKTKPVVNLWN